MHKGMMPVHHEPTPRSEVKSAADPYFDAMYGQGDPDKQKFYGGQSFADLRDQMNDRRRQTARRTGGRW